MPQSYYKKPTFAIPRTIFRESNQEPKSLSLGQGHGKSMENVLFCRPSTRWSARRYRISTSTVHWSAVCFRRIIVSLDRITRPIGDIEQIYILDFLRMLWHGEVI